MVSMRTPRFFGRGTLPCGLAGPGPGLGWPLTGASSALMVDPVVRLGKLVMCPDERGDELGDGAELDMRLGAQLTGRGRGVRVRCARLDRRLGDEGVQERGRRGGQGTPPASAVESQSHLLEDALASALPESQRADALVPDRQGIGMARRCAGKRGWKKGSDGEVLGAGLPEPISATDLPSSALMQLFDAIPPNCSR
jgi:hypothetical protein